MIRPLALAFALTRLLTALHAQVDLQALVDHSPFGQAPKAKTDAAPAPDVPLEFRGVVVEGTETYFSVYDPSTSKGMWLKQGEQGSIIVRNYNSDAEVLTIERGGKTFGLKLKQATIAAAAAPRVNNTANRNVRPNFNRPGGNNNNRQATAESKEEVAKRLEAVAAEVRRRRALRQAAISGGNSSPRTMPENEASSSDSSDNSGNDAPPPPSEDSPSAEQLASQLRAAANEN